MSDESSTVCVKILNKKYDIRCPSEQIHALQESANYLNDKIQDVSNKQSAHGIERLILSAALNLSHELMVAKKQEKDYIKTMSARIGLLHKKIEEALTTQEQMEL